MNIWILIIMIAGGYGTSSGVGVTPVEFSTQLKCEVAKEIIINNNKFSRIDAYCVSK